MTARSSAFYVDHAAPGATMRLTKRFGEIFRHGALNRDIVIVCVGTDRCTGDSLGPLAGSLLGKYRSSLFEIYGNLEAPVHALNLDATIDRIYRSHDNPFVVAIDACLGNAHSIGSVFIGEGPLRPGAGVNKQLPAVGDIHVSGIVSIGGLLGYYSLQNTRLHLVMSMAELISRSLFVAIKMASLDARNPVTHRIGSSSLPTDGIPDLSPLSH